MFFNDPTLYNVTWPVKETFQSQITPWQMPWQGNYQNFPLQGFPFQTMFPKTTPQGFQPFYGYLPYSPYPVQNFPYLPIQQQNFPLPFQAQMTPYFGYNPYPQTVPFHGFRPF